MECKCRKAKETTEEEEEKKTGADCYITPPGWGVIAASLTNTNSSRVANRQFLRSACFDVPPPPGENNTNLKVRNGAFHERHEGKTIARSPRRIKDKRVPVAAGVRLNQTHQA